jgi:hypothetical protein
LRDEPGSVEVSQDRYSKTKVWVAQMVCWRAKAKVMINIVWRKTIQRIEQCRAV